MHMYMSGISKEVEIRRTRKQHILTEQTWLALLEHEDFLCCSTTAEDIFQLLEGRHPSIILF